MLGNVFSPYYAWARQRIAGGAADPLQFCALNVALYGDGGKRWSLTERGRDCVTRSPHALRIGPSALRWDADTLTIDIDEVTVPIPTRIRGRVRLQCATRVDRVYALDAEGKHRWTPLAPCARVEAELTAPRLRWSGRGYLDSNAGDAPLEQAFSDWDWARTTAENHTDVLYDVRRRSGEALSLALRFDRSGGTQAFAAPPPVRLPRTLWGLPRETRSDSGHAAKVLATLEDTPFYARSVVSAHWHDHQATVMHETLSLDRFRAGWVRLLLPFRMPRALR